MHPIIKNEYVSLNILGFVDVTNVGIYLIQILLTTLIVFVAGVVVGFPYVTVIDSIVNIVASKMKKHIKR